MNKEFCVAMALLHDEAFLGVHGHHYDDGQSCVEFVIDYVDSLDSRQVNIYYNHYLKQTNKQN